MFLNYRMINTLPRALVITRTKYFWYAPSISQFRANERQAASILHIKMETSQSEIFAQWCITIGRCSWSNPNERRIHWPGFRSGITIYFPQRNTKYLLTSVIGPVTMKFTQYILWKARIVYLYFSIENVYRRWRIVEIVVSETEEDPKHRKHIKKMKLFADFRIVANRRTKYYLFLKDCNTYVLLN